MGQSFFFYFCLQFKNTHPPFILQSPSLPVCLILSPTHTHSPTASKMCSKTNARCSSEMQLCRQRHMQHTVSCSPCLSCSSETVYECPDYQTAGENSCFFNKNDTSIWVNYNITVVATNALGSAFSDPVDIDVVYIGERMCATLRICSHVWVEYLMHNVLMRI